MDEYVHAEGFQFVEDVGDAAVADVGHVFFEGESEDSDAGAHDGDFGVDEHFDEALGDIGAHAVVDAASCEDDLGMVAQFFGLGGEVVGVYADAMSADEPGGEPEEVPFGGGGVEHVLGADADFVEDDGEFVHERDIEVALGVFDDFGGFGDFDGRGAEHTCRDDGGVGVGDAVEGGGIVA